MKNQTYQDLEVNVSQDLSQIYLYDWFFHFNPFTSQWAAVPREKHNDYWSDYHLEGVLRSSNIQTLIDILHRSKGDMKVIQELIKK